MKKNQWILIAGIAIVAACNEAPKKEKSQQDTVMNHETMGREAQKKNEMMSAMDKSMMEMHHAEQTGNADYDFATMMIPHHQGAIEMAKLLLEKGKSDSLKKFANKVISDQNTEITQLKSFLARASKAPIKDTAALKSALGKSMDPMMKAMVDVKLAGNVDQDFVDLMIPHHESAVAMAKAYLPYAENAEIKKIAQTIIRAQEQEIKWLKKQF